jgi:N,N-dimethylformamidase
MAETKIFGYGSKLSVKQGESIDFHVSADGTNSAHAQLVRLIHGDENTDGPGFVEEQVDHPVNGAWAVKKQFTQLGSYLVVDDPKQSLSISESFSLFCFIWPTLPHIGQRQTLLGRWDTRTNEGYALGINPQGRLEFWVGDGTEIDYITAELPLAKKVWYFVGVTFDPRTGVATLYQEGVLNRYNSLIGKVVPYDFASHVQTTFRFKQKNRGDVPFLIAGSLDSHVLRGNFVNDTYAGKIDRFGVCNRVLTREEMDHLCKGARPAEDSIIGLWDTTKGYSQKGIGLSVIDTGPNGLTAKGVNHPVRAVTGWNWSGKNDCFRLAPEEYGGVEFHREAVTDCRWEVTKSMQVPPDLRSGVYAIRLRAGDGVGLGEEYIVFFVRPATPQARLCFLVPTASYLAYANEKLSFDAQIIQPMTGQPPIISDIDIETYKNRDFGLSTYDSYEDGAGVSFSSYKRPIVNMRPKYRISSMGVPWQFPADLSIVGWLEQCGYSYDIVTDEDLHREGLSALSPYKCVMTGTHPEYVSERMLDAQEDFVAQGGRLIYMGGNGYYWCIGFYDDEPWCMEVRKLDSGMRAWAARAGEHYLQTTGEKSGLWRNRGRAPQKLTGVGFIGEGFETSAPFRRMPDSYHRTVSWICDGLSNEIVGDEGLAYGGAAGLELDRYDLSLGTPPHTRIIASSGGHSDNYVLVTEELLYAYAGLVGTLDYRIRADMTYFTAPNNGAVFSTGSIAFGQALPAKNYRSDAARLLQNVVNSFLKDGTLPGAKWTLEEKQWR